MLVIMPPATSAFLVPDHPWACNCSRTIAGKMLLENVAFAHSNRSHLIYYLTFMEILFSVVDGREKRQPLAEERT